jgi:hypothetical protein
LGRHYFDSEFWGIRKKMDIQRLATGLANLSKIKKLLTVMVSFMSILVTIGIISIILTALIYSKNAGTSN